MQDLLWGGGKTTKVGFLEVSGRSLINMRNKKTTETKQKKK